MFEFAITIIDAEGFRWNEVLCLATTSEMEAEFTAMDMFCNDDESIVAVELLG